MKFKQVIETKVSLNTLMMGKFNHVALTLLSYYNYDLCRSRDMHRVGGRLIFFQRVATSGSNV